MAMRAKATPEGYHTLNPILRVTDVPLALVFYGKAFDAVEQFRREMHGRVLIAVITIGDSHVMIADRQVEPERPADGDPRGNGLSLKIYVDGVDEVFKRSIDAGATQIEPPTDQFFGERSGDVTDPFGYTWRLAQLLQELPHEEIERRMHERATGAGS